MSLRKALIKILGGVATEDVPHNEVQIVQTPAQTVVTERVVLDFREQLDDIRRLLDANVPAWSEQGRRIEGLTPLPFWTMPEEMRKKMKAVTDAVKKMNDLADEFKEVDDIVNDIALGKRKINSVKITVSGASPQAKSKTLEITLDRDSVVRLLQLEQQRLQTAITSAQAEAHAAINAIAPAGGTNDVAAAPTTGRRIRTGD